VSETSYCYRFIQDHQDSIRLLLAISMLALKLCKGIGVLNTVNALWQNLKSGKYNLMVCGQSTR